jgi:Protein required for attachment to host cells
MLKRRMASIGREIGRRIKGAMETEEDSRLFKAIAQQIEGILRRNRPLSWAFAAPAEINPAILQHIAKDLHKILDQNVKHDLTKVPGHSLLEHFGLTTDQLHPEAGRTDLHA